MPDISISGLVASSYTRSATKIRQRGVQPPPNVNDSRIANMTGVALIPEPHVLRKGFPYSPPLSLVCPAELSADGTYIPERTYPWESVYTDAHTRFLAQENMVDDIAAKWHPFYTSGIDYYFTWSGLIEPRLEEIEYRIGKELYPTMSMRIVDDASLVSSFNDGFDDASSFMIAVAGVINSAERASLMRVGDTLADSIEIGVDEYFYIRNQYGTATMKTPMHPAKMLPFYMVLINDPTKTELNVAMGTSRIFRAIIPNRDAVRSLKVRIGEDLAGSKTLDMNLFEATLFPYAYGGPMSSQQIITAMADVYGSAS